MPIEPLRLMILGAHPDDAEYHAGGLAFMYRRLGHTVKMVSLTDGSAGHHAHDPQTLAGIRRGEARASAAVIGATYDVWDHPDGRLQATLDLRHQVVRAIREFRPDLVLTHRTNDYHPDHRATGQAVQDASFLLRVPRVVPEVPILPAVPVIAHMSDLFTKPTPLAADVILDITDALETVVAMLACHRSQVFEWLPWLEGLLDRVPEAEDPRRAWLREWYGGKIRPRAERYRAELAAAYGAERGKVIEFAEIYEISEYGSPLGAEARRRLFGFLTA